MAKAIDIRSESQVTPLLEQVAGKGRGRVFELSISEIRLGRDEENDIVISDESVSRHHATIEKTSDGQFVITDNQSKNGVVINKNRVLSSPLSHGDIIQMGHFVFRYRVPGSSSVEVKLAEVPLVSNENLPEISRSPNKDRKRFYLYGGLILFVGVMWVLSQEDTKPTVAVSNEPSKEEKFKPSNLPELNENNQNTRARDLEDPITRIDKEISNLENKENSVKESEIYFKKGQRDYFNKNYLLAINNFDTSISLWSRHPLASYYRGLAAHDSEVEAEKNREIGLKYFNSLQYSRAIYHFKLAIDGLAHVRPEDNAAKKIIQECERYIGFSQRKLKALELVP